MFHDDEELTEEEKFIINMLKPEIESILPLNLMKILIFALPS